MALMDAREEADIRRHLAAWGTANAFLERERSRRLRAMTDDECREAIARIFAGPHAPALPRPCGLIEQQRLFLQLR